MMEKFDLEKAKAGRKLTTSKGIEVTQWVILGACICYLTPYTVVPIIVDLDGKSSQYGIYDLYLAPDEMYVNIVKGELWHKIFHSEEEARLHGQELKYYESTCKLLKL